MTRGKIKEISLAVWRYLAEHPEIQKKCDLLQKLWKQIAWHRSHCPLCERYDPKGCKGCPLYVAGEDCRKAGSAYDRWSDDDADTGTRKEAATRIVEIVSAWEL
jgi:hypothetical protein